MDYGIWSLIPPIVAILLAFLLKDAIIALMTAVVLGCFVLMNWNPAAAFSAVLDSMVGVFAGRWAVIVAICIALAFGMSKLIQDSGSGQSLVYWLTVEKQLIKTKRGTCMLTWLLGVILYLNASLSMMLTGVIMKPFNDAMKVSHEKQCLMIKTSGHAACGVVPFGQWGGMLLGLISGAGIANASSLLFKVVSLNFYGIIVIVSQLVMCIFGWNFFGIKKAEERADQYGYLDAPDTAEFKASQENRQESTTPANKAGSPLLVLVPMLATMVIAIVYILCSGHGDLMKADVIGGLFWGMTLSSMLLIALTTFTKVFSFADTMNVFIKGMGNSMQVLVILVFALALGDIISTMETGVFLASIFNEVMSVHLLPAMLFIITCVIGFATGSCLGTASTMVPIAISWAVASGANLPLTIAAAWSGSFFGDETSPISDSTYMVTGIIGCNVYNHVKTILPYGLVWAGASLVCFLAAGFIL